jgi:hypothetical protein
MKLKIEFPVSGFERRFLLCLCTNTLKCVHSCLISTWNGKKNGNLLPLLNNLIKSCFFYVLLYSNGVWLTRNSAQIILIFSHTSDIVLNHCNIDLRPKLRSLLFLFWYRDGHLFQPSSWDAVTGCRCFIVFGTYVCPKHLLKSFKCTLVGYHLHNW